eukprot:CAMPEP_0195511908 /NCGR_PEP_ID=MMETSP0794_2-20130614/4063_1 /TAXON_ID=515487 /ORGANISM="Stephanopyxis turris, Strain CCMP 815" /LENGTH=390 /DNA_ID=CAMNT_0040639593 /DNA_START=67 /DNA_END=1239 /DNA_ORIENTATION=-
MSGYSTNERQAGVLILRFLDELNQRAGGTDENLLVASECIAKALNIDAEKDAASLNLEGVKLLEALQLPEATATTAPTQAAIPRLAALKNSLKFQKYLEKVTEMGVFKGTEEGSEQHTARLKKVVEKFVSKYPTELENAGTASKPQLSAAEATEAADKFKAEGNEKLKAKDFRAAVASYTKAIETDPNGPSAHVYYGNRAAARQYLRDFAGAAEDARASITAKPEYLKSYIRLAQACSELKQWDEAISACNKALEIDSTNASVQTLLAKAEQHKNEVAAPAPAPAAAAGGGLPDLASMMGGGGMPDLSGMMQNPMVQNMMNSMMQNPEMMKNMMSSVGSMMGGQNGGMPDMSAMMNDPNIRRMAEQVRGSMGGAAPAGGDAEEPTVEEVN